MALAEWGGGLVAREAKAARAVGGTVWARRGEASAGTAARLLKLAVRVPDPFYAIRADWVVRRLAPDCSRIELADLPGKRDEQKLLRAMGWETANMHLGTRRAGVRADLKSRPPRWLADAAVRMAEAVSKDWRQWQRGQPAR